MARSLGPALLGRPLDGVWHTAIVLHGKEYFFGGGGIEWCRPGGTVMGSPHQVEDLGETEISEDLFQDYLRTQSEDRFRGDRYDLFRHNCNNFSNETAQFLVGRGIPQHIVDLPNEILATPMGQMLAPMIQQMTPSGASIPFTQPHTTSTSPSSSSSTKSQSLNFPVTELITFDQALKVEGISKKLEEINSNQPSDDKLAETELKIILGIAKGLVRLSDENFDVLMKMSRWKKSDIFPLLDILRFKLAKNSFENEKQVERVISILCDNLSGDQQVNAMLAVRGLSNFMQTRWNHLMNTNVLNNIVGLLPTSHQNLEIAVSTFIYNSSVKLIEKKDLDSSILLASTLVLQVLPIVTQKESEYRCLVALGNILKTGSEEVTQFLLSLETELMVSKLQLQDERSAGCVQQIVKLLKTDNSSGLALD